MIPGDGDIVEGIATVDESAITGESAPGDPRVRRRPELGHRRHDGAVRPHRRARSRRGPGESFVDRMIALVEGAQRQKTPERDRADDPARRADDHLPAHRRRAAADGGLLRAAAVAGRAHRAAGLPHPDDDRRAALGDRHRRDGPARAAQRARHVRPGRRGRGRRRHAAAGQDRHDHLRQPAGHRADPGPRRRSPAELATAARLSSLADQTPEGRSIVELCAAEYGLAAEATADEAIAEFVPFTAQTRMSGLDVGRPGGPQGRRPTSVLAWADTSAPTRSAPRRPDLRRGRDTAGRGRARSGGAARVLGVDPAVRRGQARHARAVRRAAGDGHPHGHDHRRQPAAPRGRSRPRRASTTTSPRPRPRTRWR